MQGGGLIINMSESTVDDNTQIIYVHTYSHVVRTHHHNQLDIDCIQPCLPVVTYIPIELNVNMYNYIRGAYTYVRMCVSM